MKVWQPGGHLSEDRGGSVGDWSWRRTRRRIALLIGLALPYRARTAGSLVTLLAYTLVALAPPYLAKLAIDDGISQGDLSRLNELVALFLVAALAALVLSAANTYLTGWVGERMLADLRNRLFRVGTGGRSALPKAGSSSATNATGSAHDSSVFGGTLRRPGDGSGGMVDSPCSCRRHCPPPDSTRPATRLPACRRLR